MNNYNTNDLDDTIIKSRRRFTRSSLTQYESVCGRTLKRKPNRNVNNKTAEDIDYYNINNIFLSKNRIDNENKIVFNDIKPEININKYIIENYENYDPISNISYQNRKDKSPRTINKNTNNSIENQNNKEKIICSKLSISKDINSIHLNDLKPSKSTVPIQQINTNHAIQLDINSDIDILKDNNNYENNISHNHFNDLKNLKYNSQGMKPLSFHPSNNDSKYQEPNNTNEDISMNHLNINNKNNKTEISFSPNFFMPIYQRTAIKDNRTNADIVSSRIRSIRKNKNNSKQNNLEKRLEEARRRIPLEYRETNESSKSNKKKNNKKKIRFQLNDV